MAKGLEDTAFYIYNRLVSLNEVGGHPEQFGVPVAEFHEQNRERQEKWPHSLLATSTHDTKRSEDVRARINVLSEMPGEWRSALSRWSRFNSPKKTLVDGQPGSRPERGVPALPDARGSLAGGKPFAPATCGIQPIPGTDRGLHGKGDPGSQGAHQLDQPQRGVRRRGPAISFCG